MIDCGLNFQVSTVGLVLSQTEIISQKVYFTQNLAKERDSKDEVANEYLIASKLTGVPNGSLKSCSIRAANGCQYSSNKENACGSPFCVWCYIKSILLQQEAQFREYYIFFTNIVKEEMLKVMPVIFVKSFSISRLHTLILRTVSGKCRRY